MVAFVLLLACTPADTADSSAPDGDTAELPGGEDTAPVEHELDADGVVLALEELLSVGLPVQTDAMLEAYLGLLQQGEPGSCPPDEVQLDGSSCTSTSGYTYAGLSTYMEVDEGQGTTWVFSGDMEILTPDGDVYDGGGMFARTDGEDAHSVSGFISIGGTWGWTGFDGVWADGVSAAFSAGAVDASDGQQLVLDGYVTVGDHSVGFDEVTWSNASCDPKGLEGTLHVRSTSGYWFRLVVADPCTACGSVYASDDTDLGEACLDVGDALDATFAELLPGKA